ncbi:hypothetical protein [Streptomyces longwoodensis]|uniref:hypothetical protein n=1 Tax=Streptomyces longwoodensis TaxID=68231 RepID=UPI003702C153
MSSSFSDHMARYGAGAEPTGVPDDAMEAARAINTEIGRRVNLPGADGSGATGILLGGMGSERVADLAQVSIALSLADIAASLRILSGRQDG